MSIVSPEGYAPISGDDKRGYYVEGKYGAHYPIADDEPLFSIDKELGALIRGLGKDHPDVDRLLDARVAVTAEIEWRKA